MAWAKDPGWATRHESWFGDRVVRCYAERAASLDALVRRSAERHPEREVLVFEDQRLTYRQFDEQLNRIAANLAARGIGQGDRVALYCGNHMEFFLGAFGAVRRGAVAVPIGIRQQGPEIAHVLNDCGAKALVFDAAAAGRLPLAETVPSVVARFAVEGAVAGAEPFAALREPPATALAPPAIGEHDLAFIMYTSGTTGRPKGAMLTHANFVHSAMHFEVCVGHTEQTRGLLAIPGSHISGLGAVIVEMMHVGGCIVVAREFKARPCLELMVRERVSFTVFVPTMYKLCLIEPDFRSFDLRTWRVGLYGGAIMPEATIAQLAETMPQLELVNGYGATETCSPATVTLPREATLYPDSIGQTVPCGDIRIMDHEGREVPPGEAGELWIAGPMVTPGYWNNPEATAANFVGGYWKSGDIGSKDAQGYVRILDRKKDMINRAGYKVYSAEVENVLNFHPDVIECVVVPRPDPILGERVQAFVRSDSRTLAVDDLKAFCRERLADYKVPDVIRLSAEPLPRNNNGKLMKTVLRDRAADEAAKEPARPPRTTVST